MKNFSLFLFLLLPVLCMAQLTPGRYRISLAHNGKVIESGGSGSSRLTLVTPCSNTQENCQNQIWDVKKVRGTENQFLIQKVSNRLCMTYKEQINGTYGNVVLQDVFMQGQMPIAQQRFQSFSIVEDKDGIYTIQPQRQPGATERNDVFLSAKINTINVDGGSVDFEYKNQQQNPTGYNNSTNVYWKFLPVANTTSSVQVIRAPIRSGSVIVAPPSDNKIDIDFKTGGDNLEPRGFQKNLQLTIALKNRAPIVVEDVNKGQTWANNSLRRVSVPLPPDINVMDLESITLIRTVVKSWNNVDAGIADNWNLDKLTATASVKTDGRLVRTVLLNVVGSPLFRFIYENRGVTDPNAGISKTFPFSPASYQNYQGSGTVRNQITTATVIGTGGDDLRGGGNNVEILIKLKTTPVRTIYLRNLNNNENWPNDSERTVYKPVTGTPFTFADIESIELRHTGGGGIGADNWKLDKFKFTMTINGEARVLIDVLKSPEHIFTGDSRRKTYRIN